MTAKEREAVQETPSKRLKEVSNSLRIIDVLTQHVQGVIHLALEIVAMKVFGESLPPAHIHQVTDKLVQAFQLG